LLFGISELSCTFAGSNLTCHEKNIPAIEQKAQEQTRFPGKNVDQERPEDSIQQAGCRKEKIVRFRRNEIIEAFNISY